MRKNIPQIGQSYEKLIIMQEVRQVKIIVSKGNFKLVSQFKKCVNTLPLDNQRTLYVVKAYIIA